MSFFLFSILTSSLALAPVQISKAPLPFADSMKSVTPWSVYNRDRTPEITATKAGLKMVLGAVPSAWPYEYQWSGVKRTIRLDVARNGRIVADVSQVGKGSYAHLELAVLDASGKEVKILRSASLNEPGQISFDLTKSLDPALYTLSLRLIVGGANAGASATYRWLRSMPV
jgi:hypothetical protein